MISADQAKAISMSAISLRCKKEIEELHNKIKERAVKGYVNAVFEFYYPEQCNIVQYGREMMNLRIQLIDEHKAKLAHIIEFLNVQGFKNVKTQFNGDGYNITFSWELIS